MSKCELLERVKAKRELGEENTWVSVIMDPVRKHGDVEREDAQRFALMVREWTTAWNADRDRSYKLP